MHVDVAWRLHLVVKDYFFLTELGAWVHRQGRHSLGGIGYAGMICEHFTTAKIVLIHLTRWISFLAVVAPGSDAVTVLPRSFTRRRGEISTKSTFLG